MATPTQSYKRSLSGSVGAGMKSIFGGEGRRYYTLVHKVSSQYHKAGESQPIIVDEIELGRDPACQVRFDENFPTVSRRHAAIVKDGDNWKLIQLSQTNTTYLNGHPVQKEWYLQNGDEIQLSTNGPKLGFIIPEGKKGLVSSIGLTARLNLFRQQALRPYKTAIWSLAAVLVLAVAGLTFWNFRQRQDFLEQGKVLAEQIESNRENKEKADALAAELMESNKKIADYEDRLAKMAQQVSAANARARRAMQAVQSVGTGGLPEALKQVANDTYFCMFYIELGEGTEKYVFGASGTAFLLNDGKIVTAQHVINPFMGYPEDESDLLLNGLMNQNPDAFTCHFIAVSPKGDRITFKYPLSKPVFHMGSYTPVTLGTVPYDGMNLPVKIIDKADARDYAWAKAGKTGSLVADGPYSKTLPIKTHLDILGFPVGVGAEDLRNVTPIYSESFVAREGLDVDGCILLSNSETDHGNSGGPVVTVKDGQYVVVGILSGSNRLGSKTGNSSSGKWKDRVVPISVIK